MRNELELMELVDRYLDGAMDAAERTAFGSRLATNMELNAMLADQRHLREGLERLALRPAIAKAYQVHRFGKWKPWLGGASVVVALAAALGLWQRIPYEERPGTARATMLDTIVDEVRRYDTVIDTMYVVYGRGVRRVANRIAGRSWMLEDSVATFLWSEEWEEADDVSTNVARPPLPAGKRPGGTRPEFPGGPVALYDYLEDNVEHCYWARPVRGIVDASFVIDTSGKVVHAEIIGDLYPDVNAQALRVILSMPRWKPSRIGSKAIPCRVWMPIRHWTPNTYSEAPMLE